MKNKILKSHNPFVLIFILFVQALLLTSFFSLKDITQKNSNPVFAGEASNLIAPPTSVHRFYNFRNGVHFYTINQAEATYINDHLYHTFRYEGVAYYAFETPEQLLSTVHRFYNFKNGSHFYTIEQAEATYINDNLYDTYRYEGVAYYTSGYGKGSVEGTESVHRFYNFKNGSHFYTIEQAEATYINDNLYDTYRYEGVAWSAYIQFPIPN